MTTQTTADRIIATLVNHYPAALTDNEIAAVLDLPAPSVRRTRSRLEDAQQIWFHSMKGKASSFRPAPHLLDTPPSDSVQG